MYISSTFCLCLFCAKVLWAAFLFSQFGFAIFWRMNIGAKAAHKMLMKLTAGKEQGLTIFHWKATLGDTDPLILTVPGYIIWCRQTVSVVTPFSTCLYDENHFLRIYTYKLVFKKLVSSPWNKFVLLLWYKFVFWSFFKEMNFTLLIGFFEQDILYL